MPKNIELTVEIDVQKVSCPGVWLCQDGRVSLTLFALGTNYQTCLLPPTFPLSFNDIFYFRRRFSENCPLNNICCLLKNETIYCELLQFSDNCPSSTCKILAQYLGSLNDLLFPSSMCSDDGVDLLMRRCPDFPGILSPKIEIATKVRIDEICNNNTESGKDGQFSVNPCYCTKNQNKISRQNKVCHSPLYHRNCHSSRRRLNNPTPRSQYASPVHSRSNCSLPQKKPNCPCKKLIEDKELEAEDQMKAQKTLLASRYIGHQELPSINTCRRSTYDLHSLSIAPCICEICKKYHEMFHTGNTAS